uniref:Uncharacterized protein n=1 Tax=Romanomermis culicivorax TaxID=13658 RepID=A0A915KAY4_ROMCU
MLTKNKDEAAMLVDANKTISPTFPGVGKKPLNIGGLIVKWPSKETVDTALASERPRPVRCATSGKDNMVRHRRLLRGRLMKRRGKGKPPPRSAMGGMKLIKIEAGVVDDTIEFEDQRRNPKIAERRVLFYKLNCKGLFWLDEKWPEWEGRQKEEKNMKTETTRESDERNDKAMTITIYMNDGYCLRPWKISSFIFIKKSPKHK